MCDEIDYIEHFFFSCKKIKRIWYEREKLLSQKYDIDIKLTQKEVLFGYYDDMYDVKLVNREFPCKGLASILTWRYNKRVCNTVRNPTLSVQFNWVNDPESIISFTLKCYKTY